MSKPQNSENLRTHADAKAARLTHKHTPIAEGWKATNPVPAFLQQPAPVVEPEPFARNINGVVIKQGATHEANTSGKPMRARIYVFWNALNSRLFYSVSIVENGNHRRVYGHQDIAVARQWLLDNGYTETYAPYYSREVQEHIVNNEVKEPEVAPVLPEGAVESKVGYCDSYGNAHLHKSDTPHGTMYRVSGEFKYLCSDCLAQRRKALDSQNYPSTDTSKYLEEHSRPEPKAERKPKKISNKQREVLVYLQNNFHLVLSGRSFRFEHIANGMISWSMGYVTSATVQSMRKSELIEDDQSGWRHYVISDAGRAAVKAAQS